MNNYYIYGNSGGINEVVNDLKGNPTIYHSIKEVLEHIADTSFGLYNKSSLLIKSYGEDSRLGRDVYMIVTEDNKFVKYMIEI